MKDLNSSLNNGICNDFFFQNKVIHFQNKQDFSMKTSSLSDKQVSENSGSRNNRLCRFPKVSHSHCHCPQGRIICPRVPTTRTSSDTVPEVPLGSPRGRGSDPYRKPCLLSHHPAGCHLDVGKAKVSNAVGVGVSLEAEA